MRHIKTIRGVVATIAILIFSTHHIARAQNATLSTRSSVVTRVLRPEIVDRLRDDNVLVTQDVRHVNADFLRKIARGNNVPTYILITRTLPHPYRNAFTFARDIRLQLDVSSNAVVIIATEADGFLGLYCADIEYSKSREIVERSALSWTNEGAGKGATQMLQLVTAKRDEVRWAQRKHVALSISGVVFLLTMLTLLFRKRRRFRRNVAPVAADD